MSTGVKVTDNWSKSQIVYVGKSERQLWAGSFMTGMKTQHFLKLLI